LRALKGIDNVQIRSLYALYPDFGIDVEAEQAALVASDVVVWQCPFYWYGMPALLTHWIEKAFARGARKQGN
jgi:glutathione-regulated potassium-efflux system ancillary protein KefF